MSYSQQQIPARAPELIWQVTADGIVIVSPSAGHVRVLNPIGTSIWHLLDGRRTLGEIEGLLVAEYDTQVPAEKIRIDFQSFLQELDHRGMVIWH